MRKTLTVIAAGLLCATSLLTPQVPCLAQTVSSSTRTFGIGIQCAPFPIVGLAVTYNPSRDVGFQAIGKTGYDIDILAARGLYRFAAKPKHAFYFSGLVGVFRDTRVAVDPLAPEETDTALGYGGGVGVEWFLSSKRNIELNLEADFIHIDFEEKWWNYDYESFSLVMLGFGLHYYLK